MFKIKETQAGPSGPSYSSTLTVLQHSPGPRSSSPRFSGLDLEEDSEVLATLQENRQGWAGPRQSSSFRLLEEALEAERWHTSLSAQPAESSGCLGHPTCEKCRINISNQASRRGGTLTLAATPAQKGVGLNLKTRGHFWVGDELYSEKHARQCQRYSMPGTLSSRA